MISTCIGVIASAAAGMQGRIIDTIVKGAQAQGPDEGFFQRGDVLHSQMAVIKLSVIDAFVNDVAYPLTYGGG